MANVVCDESAPEGDRVPCDERIHLSDGRPAVGKETSDATEGGGGELVEGRDLDCANERVWDLDGRLGAPVDAAIWLSTTFPVPELVPPRFQPRFAVVDAGDYVTRFGSDRSHMRDAGGGWLQPPPPWPAPAGRGLTLAGLLAEARQGLDLAAMASMLRG
jgi:hypothetical protein